MTPGVSAVLWFLAILAMIPAALWLLRRTPIGGGASVGQIRTVAVLPLSPSQRVVTVEVGQGEDRRWLVLGITPQSITTLHTMAPQEEPVLDVADLPSGAVSTPFAQVLGRLRREPGAK